MAPGLPLLNLVKLIAIFYIKSWAVLVTNVPHETVFKVIRIIIRAWHSIARLGQALPSWTYINQ